MRNKCNVFGASVQVYQADSTKIVHGEKEGRSLLCGPPFPEESFDRILLDAPCSALGKRPQLANRTNVNSLKSFVPLQRKLMETVSIIDICIQTKKGTLVYKSRFLILFASVILFLSLSNFLLCSLVTNSAVSTYFISTSFVPASPVSVSLSLLSLHLLFIHLQFLPLLSISPISASLIFTSPMSIFFVSVPLVSIYFSCLCNLYVYLSCLCLSCLWEIDNRKRAEK